ncbi:phosphoglycolate phosphatase [Sneathiella sp.]|uniref:phosphoglycolate phosphatase n=1 Tax=Sneathiella sp. TaxID=1964365 RepID=UPI0026187692|nr:phosphoglycolate phosphatase [Sneathiella sp.]MDF2367821.1 phosphoglycolate phosphatase [Sneathiella sp.]
MQDIAVIFDLDGTLVDTAPDLHDALNHTLARAGRDTMDIEHVQGLIGHGARALLQKGLTATGGMPENERFEELVAIFFAYYKEHLSDNSKPFDGVVDALEALRAEGAKLGVCTNKSIGFAEPLLNELDLTRHFTVITGGDSFSVKKPDAGHITGTLDLMGHNGGRAFMIGDSINDIMAARNAGIPSVAVTFGYTETPVQELGPDHIIDHFNELVPLIKSL